MNISFLSSTGTFSGLSYNFSKIEKNLGDLLATSNFDGLSHLGEISKSDYLDYLKAWSEKNNRVKNTQLHVAISVRGQEKTAEELLKISKEWLDGMGYSGVPSMFFFHRDTNNNHIHIISSRVDAEGRKISDSNEIRRGLSLLRKLNGVDLSNKAKADLLKVENYQISAQSQYSVLWNSLGYRSKYVNNTLTLYKEGLKVMTIPKESILGQVKNQPLDDNRAAHIREIFSRNKGVFSIDDFNRVLKEKHNLELMFSGKKENPTGYSIIDHAERRVYKGSDIYPLKNLLSDARIFSDAEQVERVNLYARHMLDHGKLTTKELVDVARSWGLNFYRGEISYRRSVIGLVDSDIQERLYYNDRLEKASQIEVSSMLELEAVAKYYDVLTYDISPREVADGEIIERRDLKAIYEQSLEEGDLWSGLREEKVGYISYQGARYLIDLKEGYIEELEGLQLEQARTVKRGEDMDLDFIDGENISSMLGLDVYDKVETSSVDNSLKKRKRR